MALHPGSLTSAYAALQEGGFSASTMRNACERAQYRGTDTLGPYTVTFNREDGYRVSCRELPAQAGPHADVYLARTVTRGWHMAGVGVITAVTTHPNGQVTFSGPQGFRTFPWLDTLVEATPAAAQEPASTAPAMITLPPLAVTKLAATLAEAELGGGYALGRLFVQANRDGSAVIYLAS